MFRKFSIFILSTISMIVAVLFFSMLLFKSTFLNPDFYKADFFESLYTPLAADVYADLQDGNPDFTSYIDVDSVEFQLKSVYPVEMLIDYVKSIVVRLGRVEFNLSEGFEGFELDLNPFIDRIPFFVSGLSSVVFDALPVCDSQAHLDELCRPSELVEQDFHSRVESNVAFILEKNFPRTLDAFVIPPYTNNSVGFLFEFFSIDYYFNFFLYSFLILLGLIALFYFRHLLPFLRTFGLLFFSYGVSLFLIQLQFRSALDIEKFSNDKDVALYIRPFLNAVLDVLQSYALYCAFVALCFFALFAGFYYKQRTDKII